MNQVSGKIRLEYYSLLHEIDSSYKGQIFPCRAIIQDVHEYRVLSCTVCGHQRRGVENICLVCGHSFQQERMGDKSLFFPNIGLCYEVLPTQQWKEVSLVNVRIQINNDTTFFIDKERRLSQGIIEGTFQGSFPAQSSSAPPPIQESQAYKDWVPPTIMERTVATTAQATKVGRSIVEHPLFWTSIALAASPAMVALGWWGAVLAGACIVACVRWLREYYLPKISQGTNWFFMASLFGLSIFLILGFFIFGICYQDDWLYYILPVGAFCSIFGVRRWPIPVFAMISLFMIYQRESLDCYESAILAKYEELQEYWNPTEKELSKEESLDYDLDGILNEEDKCPKEAEDFDGYQDTDGCPEKDNDQDGTFDIIDKCPNLFGSGADGCPNAYDKIQLDTDEDGISDLYDQCIEQKEVFNNFNDADCCPDIIPDDLKEIAGGLQIFFELNTDVFEKENAYNTLIIDKLYHAIMNYQDLRITIAGHTDNRGSEKFNDYLSKARANKTKSALVQKGVSSSRIQTIGYGSSRPQVPNTSEENQAKNRRVVISYFGEINTIEQPENGVKEPNDEASREE